MSSPSPLSEGALSTVLSRSTLTRPKSSVSYDPLFDHPTGVMFLDIETTGLSKYYDQITLVGYELDSEYHVLLAGDDPAHLRESLARASSLVTFNGSNFDLPFLETAYEGLHWPKHHVDLRYACHRLGLSGGQKAIEKALRITCRDGFEGVDGAMAVVLWHRYLRGDLEALRELIEYNRADIRGMAYILDHVAAETAKSDLLTRMAQLHRFCRTPDIRRGLAHQHADLPPPPVHLRSPVSFKALFAGTPAENAKVVGLDITGSEARPSGFSLMSGEHAETELLNTDAEIVGRIVETRPDLVSIDSPLCLPVGRTRVTDDDPRRFCGIMRQSERILKRRGINVYPCLIPSMQRLTERGIKLAAEIRSHGIPVIECYPGAAQDIMGIPRKGAGKEWLTLGMKEFGVTGPFTARDVTHDELDAITCSLVGFFHLAGRIEALGGKGEEPMMVPDLKAPEGMVIGFSGEIAAGKTTAAHFLEAQGFAYTRISQVIDDILKKRGEEPTRENRQRVGLELHDEKGQRWLCRKALERLTGEPARIVVDGLRWPEDVQYLQERYGGRFRHVHVTAPYQARRERAAASGGGETFDDATSHTVESGVASLEALSHCRISNDGSIAAFESKLRDTILTGESRANAH
jgi:predicted nuclease with RNAse H fold/dephospho-CoA kinase